MPEELIESHRPPVSPMEPGQHPRLLRWVPRFPRLLGGGAGYALLGGLILAGIFSLLALQFFQSLTRLEEFSLGLGYPAVIRPFYIEDGPST